jgi:hypothetical protein
MTKSRSRKTARSTVGPGHDRPGQDRPVVLDLPTVVDATSLAEAQARVIAAAAAGKITPRQGLSFSTMLEYRRRALETVELEAQLAEIEEADARERAKGRR